MRRYSISSIATFGAPLLVGALLVYRIINGHWQSVAFIAIVFAVVLMLYLRFVPLEEDNEVPASNAENPEANGRRPSSTDRPTQPSR